MTNTSSNGIVTLGLNSDTNPTPGTIVARDNSGNIAAAALTLDYPAIIYAGTNFTLITRAIFLPVEQAI